MEVVVIAQLTAAALVFAGWPLVSPRRHLYYLEDMLAGGTQQKLNYLYAQRDVVYDNIKDLEAEHAMGKLADEDFIRLRTQLFAEAQEIIRRIDEVQVRREIESLIEEDARRRRKVKSDA